MTQVTAPASRTASGMPFDASDSRTSPVTVGKPCAGLRGNDVTHFSSACPPPSAGIARKSPAGYAGTYTFGGIVQSPLAYATNASRTASSARTGDTAASTCARLKTGIGIGAERSLARFPRVAGMAVTIMVAGLAPTLGLALGSAQPLTIILTYNQAPEGRSGEALGMRIMANKVTQIAVPLAFGGVGAAMGATPVFLATGVFLFAAGLISLRGGG